MHSKLQSQATLQRSLSDRLVACAYLLGLLALPISIALCGELVLNEAQPVGQSIEPAEIA